MNIGISKNNNMYNSYRNTKNSWMKNDNIINYNLKNV